MLEPKLGSSPFEHPSQTFSDVHFVLLGFNPIHEQKVRSKLVESGGVDVGQYNPNCTHVIVDKLVYDDPICVAARRDEKTLVTALWVDHSFDTGMPLDPTSIMYRPVRDLKGIPGANSLTVCLTGYQRQCRDDIMTMVGLMGAHFSKPLVANTVTHLICYKFEGEKYELAKKMRRIKLVNHRWLEDCLNAWEIVPEAGYDKSGYELEMMEAEAKDSEEEAEDSQDIAKKLCEENRINASPNNLQIGMSRAKQSPVLKGEASRNLLNTTASRNVDKTNDMVLATEKAVTSVHAATLNNVLGKHPEGVGNTLYHVTGSEQSEQPLRPQERTPVSARAGFELPCTSGSAKKTPPDGAKLSPISYSRKTARSTTLPLFSGDMESNISSFPKVNLGKSSATDGFDISSIKADHDKDRSGTGFGCIRTPLKETDIRTPPKGTDLTYEEGNISTLPGKRKMDVSCVTPKLKKTRHSPEVFISKGLHVNDRTEVSESASLLDGPFDVSNRLSPGSNAHYMDKTAAQISNSSAKLTTPKTSDNTRTSLPPEMLDSKIDLSDIRRGGNAVEESRVFFTGLKRTSLASKPEARDAMNKVEHDTDEVWGPQNELQDIEVPSARTKSIEIEKSNSPANLDLRQGLSSDSMSKPLRRKVIAKKNLGSRPKLGAGNSTNEKGSIYLNQTASRKDAGTCLSGGKKTAGHVESVNSEKSETITPTVTVDTAKGTGINNISRPDNEANTETMDDDTEAPEEKDDLQLEATLDQEKSGEVEPTHMEDTVKGKKSGVDLVTNQSKHKVLGLHDGAITSDENENGTEFEKAVCAQRITLGEPTNKDSAVKQKLIKGKKLPSTKTKKKSIPSTKEVRISKEEINGDKADKGKNKEKIEMKKEKSIPYQTGKTKKSLPAFKSNDPMEVDKDEKEKENRPIDIGDQNASHGEQQDGKLASKSNRMPMKIDLKSGQTCPESVRKVKVEPVWFILSGHKLQRKEFQQVIKRLKGRVCRDSHQWSYQATHFIVPDPIRRTEKFFAAVASGRWILKTDYLAASTQAGRFLAEEPYEWHKNGLSEDGSINLEAPRKWRLLREKTGHGAFHGMRIIIYGECIAPPLDTLKRVVKAGDGTILATSPPYTRYLKSGIDFAIVSPGMPRVDMWVQEFLEHEIPCVVADYLVEYVCKPGYSLERHVQYNTHTWAERSFAKLLSRSEEIVGEQTPPEGYGTNDVQCQVCGSRDRGDVMLICGDESGCAGCGVGMHIDCCDPPLEGVPEEDWFCPKCIKDRDSGNVGKSMKKRTSSSRRK